MNLYSEKRKDNFTEHNDTWVESVLEQLFVSYKEHNGRDSDAIRTQFDCLDEVLDKLTLREYDKVWDTACKLCWEYEREAFLEGMKMGARLVMELGKDT